MDSELGNGQRNDVVMEGSGRTTLDKVLYILREVYNLPEMGVIECSRVHRLVGEWEILAGGQEMVERSAQ